MRALSAIYKASMEEGHDRCPDARWLPEGGRLFAEKSMAGPLHRMRMVHAWNCVRMRGVCSEEGTYVLVLECLPALILARRSRV